MTTTLDAVLSSWRFDPWLIGTLLLTALVYLRGWRVLHRHDVHRWPAWQPFAFLAGLTVVFLALASPLDPFAFFLLQVHMVQHLLLMMLAPPLIWLGAPALPLLRGLPLAIQRHALGPFLCSEEVHGLLRVLTHPVTAWALFVGATWLWHVPRFFDLALRSEEMHHLEHACFLGTALLFWWPVVLPPPAAPTWSRWLILPYLLLADVQNTALSALLAFSDRVIYSHYEQVPRLGGISVLHDQAAAGVLMWVPGSIAYLIPLAYISCWLLYARPADKVTTQASSPRRLALPVISTTATVSPPDLLRIPGLSALLRWRHARIVFQLPLLALALVVILDGLLGPQLTPLNLAGVLPWIHWRGFLIVGLLVVGNVFCLACPFMVPRTLARRWLRPERRWPRWLQGKWLALVLLVLFFVGYEVFALWDSPWLTAWIVVTYFVAAFAVDGWFRGAAFCKYVCPIGQFNFVQSLVSPFTIRIRDPEICTRCVTRDCIRGNERGPGCELRLRPPQKTGNMDCTLCLDCVHACPHDNLGLLGVVPGADLWQGARHPRVGRLDLAALVVVLVFAAFANAAGMVAPVLEMEDRLTLALGLTSRWPLAAAGLLAGITLVPAFLVGLTAAWSRAWSADSSTLLATVIRGSWALVPLGVAMWAAHYTFHLLGSMDAVVPAATRFVHDIGLSPDTFASIPCCCRTAPAWLLQMELLLLDAGLLGSLYVAWRIAQQRAGRTLTALKALLPWAFLVCMLFLMGVWLVMQPMEMRGSMGRPG